MTLNVDPIVVDEETVETALAPVLPLALTIADRLKFSSVSRTEGESGVEGTLDNKITVLGENRYAQQVLGQRLVVTKTAVVVSIAATLVAKPELTQGINLESETVEVPDNLVAMLQKQVEEFLDKVGKLPTDDQVNALFERSALESFGVRFGFEAKAAKELNLTAVPKPKKTLNEASEEAAIRLSVDKDKKPKEPSTGIMKWFNDIADSAENNFMKALITEVETAFVEFINSPGFKSMADSLADNLIADKEKAIHRRKFRRQFFAKLKSKGISPKYRESLFQIIISENNTDNIKNRLSTEIQNFVAFKSEIFMQEIGRRQAGDLLAFVQMSLRGNKFGNIKVKPEEKTEGGKKDKEKKKESFLEALKTSIKQAFKEYLKPDLGVFVYEGLQANINSTINTFFEKILTETTVDIESETETKAVLDEIQKSVASTIEINLPIAVVVDLAAEKLSDQEKYELLLNSVLGETLRQKTAEAGQSLQGDIAPDGEMFSDKARIILDQPHALVSALKGVISSENFVASELKDSNFLLECFTEDLNNAGDEADKKDLALQRLKNLVPIKPAQPKNSEPSEELLKLRKKLAKQTAKNKRLSKKQKDSFAKNRFRVSSKELEDLKTKVEGMEVALKADNKDAQQQYEKKLQKHEYLFAAVSKLFENHGKTLERVEEKSVDFKKRNHLGLRLIRSLWASY